MKKRKKKNVWRIVKITAFSATIVVGLAGFLYYYSSFNGLGMSVSKSAYSTVRLFAGAFDVDVDKAMALRHGTLAVHSLDVVKWIALFFTGNVFLKLIRPYLSNMIVRARRFLWERKKKQVLIVGNNPENTALYKTAEKSDGRMILSPSVADCDELSRRKVKSVTVNFSGAAPGSEKEVKDAEKWIADVIERAFSREGANCTIIINTHNDEENLHISRAAVMKLNELLQPYKDEITGSGTAYFSDARKMRRFAGVLGKIKIYAFSDRAYEAVYLDLQRESLGVLQFKNKYQMIASDFVMDHPLTEHISKEMFDSFVDNGCVSEELGLNVIYVGFGELNREIFKTSYANNQYIKRSKDGIPVHRTISYHIFDKKDYCTDRNLNHNLFRFENEFMKDADGGKIDRADYFEIPPVPAEVKFYYDDPNCASFFEKLKEICISNRCSINQVVVACGTDLENMDLAQRIAEKREDWRADNIHIYAQVQNVLSDDIAKYSAGSDYVTFGNEESLVFNYDNLCRNKTEELAIQRSLIYNKEELWENDSRLSEDDFSAEAVYRWYVTLDHTRRLSNLFNILSLRMKLQLLGLDFCRGEKPDGAGEILEDNDAYFEVYAKDIPPKIKYTRTNGYRKDIYDKEVLPLKEDFTKNFVRQNMAVLEHYQWNAMTISCGYVPQDIKTTLESENRRYLPRRHASLTTFEGLLDYRKIAAEYSNKPESKFDTIRYDYQILDEAWWFLDSKGFTVYKRW